MTAFCASSKEALPDTSRTLLDSGSRPDSSARPISLSTALCRPMSSRTSSSSPSGENNAAACRPPVRSNTRCSARSRSGSTVSRSGPTRTGGESAIGHRAVVRTASRPALPHSPHDDVVYTLRSSVMSGTGTPGVSRTSTTLYVGEPPPSVAPAQYTMFATSSARPTTPSLTRNPAASAKSSPGVRMVTASGLPLSRISSGSSATRVSVRALGAPSLIRSTRRRSVTRPMASLPVLSVDVVPLPRLGRQPPRSALRTGRAPAGRRARPAGGRRRERGCR